MILVKSRRERELLITNLANIIADGTPNNAFTDAFDNKQASDDVIKTTKTEIRNVRWCGS